MGMVRAVQKGELSPGKVSPKLRETAKDMSPEDVRHFAKTRQAGLPEHVKKAYVQGFVKKAVEAGMEKEGISVLAEKAGFTKEAIGWVVPVLEMLAGGAAARWGARAAAKTVAARAAASAGEETVFQQGLRRQKNVQAGRPMDFGAPPPTPTKPGLWQRATNFPLKMIGKLAPTDEQTAWADNLGMIGGPVAIESARQMTGETDQTPQLNING